MLRFLSFSVYIYEGIYNAIKNILSSFKYVNKVVLYMKRIIPLLLAVLILSACGTPTTEVTPTPEATPISDPPVKPTAEPSATPTVTPLPTETPGREPVAVEGNYVIAWPQESAYELRLDDIGLTITVPQEAAAKTIVTKGFDYVDDSDADVTFYFVREGGYYARMIYVEAVPRNEFFNPSNWYQDENIRKSILAVSENLIYLIIPPTGGTDISPTDPEIESYDDVRRAIEDALFRADVEEQSVLPKYIDKSFSDAANALAAKGDATITRAEAAQLAYDILKAENKDKSYPLRYTDVDANSEYAHAIAYLDSYGLLTRYSREGEAMDGEQFRPDEPITRAEFVMLLHRLSFQSSPVCFGETLESLPVDYWGFNYVNYAWRCGWLELDANGDIHADEPITAAEAAHALSAVAEHGGFPMLYGK